MLTSSEVVCAMICTNEHTVDSVSYEAETTEGWRTEGGGAKAGDGATENEDIDALRTGADCQSVA
jgi:hypothetical protein